MRHVKFIHFAVLVVATLFACACITDCAFGASAVSVAHTRSVNAATNYTGTKKLSYATISGDHKQQCTKISVDVSDLKLTASQAQQVMDWVHFDGEYFWLDTLGEGKYTMDAKKQHVAVLTYTCLWTDSSITARRAEMERAVKNALVYAKSAKTHAAKIHRLHDWIVDSCSWYYTGKAQDKNAYSCLVLGRGDCSAYSLALTVLMQRAGYTTAICQNLKQWHQWNMVRISGKWYHVDTRWDDAWSYNKRYYWPNCICHKWLLMPDSVLNADEHAGWTVYYHGAATTGIKATSKKYAYTDFMQSCKIGTTFKVGIYGYKVTSGGKVRVQTVYARLQKSYTIPATVTYEGKKYKVTGIKAKAFKSCKKATKLVIKGTRLTKKGLKNVFKGSAVKTVKVPKSRYAKYKKWLKKSNSGKKVTVKK